MAKSSSKKAHHVKRSFNQQHSVSFTAVLGRKLKPKSQGRGLCQSQAFWIDHRGSERAGSPARTAVADNSITPSAPSALVSFITLCRMFGHPCLPEENTGEGVLLRGLRR